MRQVLRVSVTVATTCNWVLLNDGLWSHALVQSLITKGTRSLNALKLAPWNRIQRYGRGKATVLYAHLYDWDEGRAVQVLWCVG